MKFTKQLRSFLILLTLCAPAKGQTIADILDGELTHTLDSMHTATGAIAYSAAIQFSDGSVWANAQGFSTVVPFVDVTTDEALLIGSVTKTITSACIMQLADEGLLNIDDSLHEYLPPMLYVDPNITIRQLMQHTSGLADVLAHPHHNDSMMADITRVWTGEELLQYFTSPPLSQPGTTWSYCNTNYMLLGLIIKQVTGNEFYTELRNRFYTPLGLSSFAIPAFETMTAPVAHLWLDITGDNIQDDAHDFYMDYMALNSSAGACGGYFSTPADCAKWTRKYLRGDLLSAAMMAQAQTTVPAPGSQGGHYGLGMMKNSTDFLGYLAYGHGGDLAYHASSWYFPALDCSITVLTNDDKKNSWVLIPVVRELLRTYILNNPASVSPIEANGKSVKLNAYPNPFTNEFTVEVNSPVKIEGLEISVTDVLGRSVRGEIKKQVSGNAAQVHFNGTATMAPGLYFITINDGNTWTKTIKISK